MMGKLRRELAHDSRAYLPLLRPNPVSPYRLLVHTSYVVAALDVQHNPLIVVQVRDRAVRHRCWE